MLPKTMFGAYRYAISSQQKGSSMQIAKKLAARGLFVGRWDGASARRFAMLGGRYGKAGEGER